MFNPCGEFRWSPEGPVSQMHSPHLLVGAPGIFSDLLRSVQMLKREWGAESNGKLPHLFIPSKTATLVPEFTVEDLPLERTATLVPAFAVKDVPLGRTLWWWWWWWYYFISNFLIKLDNFRPRWSRSYHTRHWIRGSGVQTRPGSMYFLERKNHEYDLLRKGSTAVGLVDLWHVKESQAEIRASEQNLSDFSSSL